MPTWGWVCLGLLGGVIGLFILALVYVHFEGEWEERRYKRDGEEMIGWIVQANSQLFEPGPMGLPAQVLIAFDGRPDEPDLAVARLARRLAELKRREPETDAEDEIADLVTDERYRPNERHRLPAEFTDGRRVYSAHVWIDRTRLPDRVLRRPFVRCLVIRDDPRAKVLMTDYRPGDDAFDAD